MSGGTAFVYKLRADRINSEALDAGELHLLKVDEEQGVLLKRLVEQHQAETGSLLAARLLDDWANALEDFTLILPRDYASVLKIRSDAITAGLDPDGEATWAKILEVTNG
jgi:glutamate synthase (NADPH/NADH) large chain